MIDKEALMKPLIILLIVIFGSAILVRAVTGGQTLSDYADKNNIPIHSETTYDEGDNK